MNDADIAYLRSTYLYGPASSRSKSVAPAHLAEPIRELLSWGYSLLPVRFSSGDLLFRLQQYGSQVTVRNFHVRADDVPTETFAVECAMRVLFVTHELTDAVSLVASDSVTEIIAIEADYFNEQYRHGKAATLAIGDAGIVFRYPFVCEPVPESAIALRFAVGRDATSGPSESPAIPVNMAGRAAVRTAIEAQLERMGRKAATVVQVGL